MEADTVMDVWFVEMLVSVKRKLLFVLHLKRQQTESRLLYWFLQLFWLFSITEVLKKDLKIFR
jgi:hypothetical protein